MALTLTNTHAVQVVLRALNDAKTAFASVELQRGVFFQDYSFTPPARAESQPQLGQGQDSQAEEEPFLGKIPLRVGMNIFYILVISC